MKWRHSLVYLLVLALLGGYYYYFEVVKKREKDEAERAQKRLFSFSAQAVDEVFIEAQGKPAVQLLKKDGSWVLQRPVNTEADQGVVDTLVHSLVELEKNRDVDSTPKDVSLYGLADPGLVVRFRVGETWQEIRFGSKNPTGESHYAVKGEDKTVFLLAAAQMNALNKGPDELRRRDLLSFDEEGVQKITVSWATGERVELVRDEKNKEAWRCPQEPDRRMKPSKVENILNQLRWLRAKTFLEDSVQGDALWESGAPEVHVLLQGADGSEKSLRIGRKIDDAASYVAVSSQMSTLVTVDGSVLKDLPKTVRDVEDRSVATVDSKNISRVEYTLRGQKGELIAQEDNKWVHVTPDGSRRRLKESWRVRPVFWEWEDLEYEEKASGGTACSDEKNANRMVFYAKDGNAAVLSWPGLDRDDDAQLLPLCTGSGDTFLVRSEKIREIEKKFQEVLNSPSEKASS